MLDELVKIVKGFSQFYFAWFKAIILFLVPDKWVMKDVSNETVLITGGGSGLGQLLALNFASLGSKVVLLDINENGLNETKKMIKKLGGISYAYKCDLTNRAQTYQVVEKIKSEINFVSILINNAGIVSGKPIMEINDDSIDRLFNVNVISHYWLVKSFLPEMMKRNHGHIVSITSMSGLVGNPYLTDYSASKFAAVGLAESLWLETYFSGYDKINFTCVCPYYMDTGMFKGVQSKILPMLDPNYAAEKIVRAIRCNQVLLLMPRLLYFIYPLKALLPANCLILLDQLFDGHSAMTTFTGRTAAEKVNHNNNCISNNNNNNNKNIDNDRIMNGLTQRSKN